MGCDVRIRLPGNVRVREVSEVIGAACGFPIRKQALGNDSWCVEVSGVSIRTTAAPSMVQIRLHGTAPDGISGHEVHYHFEGNGYWRLMAPRSTAFWIAIAHRLVDFFGGSVDYNDCDRSDCDHEQPVKPNAENCPSDGAEWHSLQQRILDTKPITADELQAFEKYAAYKREPT